MNPIPGGGSLGEFRVVQPVLMLEGRAWRGHLALVGTFDFEGWTMPNGELTPGAWGEGFYDRRHPHTYFHELMLSGAAQLGRVRGSLSLGKGFAPFGSDDPMSRPVLKYPVNHHLSQILERAVAMAAIGTGPFVLEGSLYNGDEPERPGEWPRIAHRFGDSWSTRLTVHPLQGIEVQASRAKVHSPEHRAGSGPDSWKWSVSGRVDRAVGPGRAYGLIEWDRTGEANDFFVFHSMLAEGAWSWGPHRLYYRFERTDRPEDERTSDPFRSIRPHLENSVLGVTKWTIHTLGYGFTWDRGGLELEPFGEASYAKPTAEPGGFFDPVAFYGRDHIWSFSFGMRVSWRMAGHRMGRYGVLAGQGTSEAMTPGMNMPGM